MKRILSVILLFVVISILLMLGVMAKTPSTSPRAKFYNFSEQIIDGHIKRPTNLYIDSRQKVIFDRLLRLKKSFIRDLLDTSKLPVFK